jgi:ubiquinone/menaquinone biosynthesis C-methylase UbiE
VSDKTGYIHGYSDDEAERLVAQAEYLAPWVFDGVRLDGVRTLLEVGVGVGAETRLIRARWPELRIIGVDISAHQLRHAWRLLGEDLRARHVLLARASGGALPFVDDAADAGFVCWLLEHVPDPASVLRECARVVRPGGSVFVTEVYNASLMIEPCQPVIERYWAAANATQRRAGGHPNIGARLAELADHAGMEVLSHRFVPVLGDGRNPAQRRVQLDYFRELLRSSTSQVIGAGEFAAADLVDLWAAFERVNRAEDAIICYTMSKLEARVRR